MKKTLLLLMTPNMTLEKWDKVGFLTREMDIYEKICKQLNLNLVIFSYGRNDQKFLVDKPFAKVLELPNWIPRNIPFRVQNLIYHLIAPIIYFKTLRNVKIIKTNQYAAAFVGLWLKLLFWKPLVIRMGFYHSHFKPISRWNQFNEKIAFKCCNLILITSKEASEYIEYKYSITKDKIVFIYNSIDVNLFKPLELRKKFDVMLVGRLNPLKNIEILMQLVKESDLKVLLIGSGELSYMVESTLGSAPNLTWLKRVDNIDLPNYYNQSNTFLIISNYEGNPKVLLEAMACGTPCIGVKVPGIRECINHNVNGIITTFNPTDIAKDVKRIIHDNLLAQKIGLNGIQWIKNNCDMEKNIQKEAFLYQRFV